MGEADSYYIQKKFCANFVYDLNGSKGPNTVGKDIGFITVFYPTDSIVAAPFLMPNRIVGGMSSQKAAGARCTELNNDSRMPNLYEHASLFINKQLIGFPAVSYSWSSSVFDAEKGWGIDFSCGLTYLESRDTSSSIFCVKR